MPAGTTDDAIAFHSALAPREDEPVIGKRFGSGFMETNLDETLKSMDIQELVICGLSAYDCVNQTVTFAKLFGYQVTVVQDAIGAPDHKECLSPKVSPSSFPTGRRGDQACVVKGAMAHDLEDYLCSDKMRLRFSNQLDPESLHRYGGG